jgi:hypothetical protein
MSFVDKASVLVAMILGLFAGSARAADQMSVKVPFAFVVDGQVMPAGRYTVTNLARGYVSIRQFGEHPTATITSAVALGSEDPAGDVPALVFLPYETDYLLIQVWLSRETGFAPYSSVSYAQRLQAAEKLVLRTVEAQ